MFYLVGLKKKIDMCFFFLYLVAKFRDSALCHKWSLLVQKVYVLGAIDNSCLLSFIYEVFVDCFLMSSILACQ